MKSFFTIFIAIIFGIIIGALSAFQAISTGWGVDVRQNGAWRIHKNLSSPNLSAHARAYLVTSGHLPLPQDQALYFFTYIDAAGKTLNADCDYELVGDEMDAFWWSVSIHSTDFEQFENSSHRYSFNMANIIRNNDGKFSIIVSSKVNKGNWLPLNEQVAQNGNNFMMSLRLYGVDKKMIDQVELLKLPILNKIGCPL